MDNKLIKSCDLPLTVNKYDINQNAHKIYNVDHAENISQNQFVTHNHYFCNESIGIYPPSSDCGTNPDYYNLIVIPQHERLQLGLGIISINKNRTFTESIDPILKNEFFCLSKESLEKIKTFPAIFATENKYQGYTDEAHMAYYGLITNIHLKSETIEISYIIYNVIPQQKLNEMVDELDIKKANEHNEFNRTHWTIKRKNIISALRKAGFKILSYQ